MKQVTVNDKLDDIFRDLVTDDTIKYFSDDVLNEDVENKSKKYPAVMKREPILVSSTDEDGCAATEEWSFPYFLVVSNKNNKLTSQELLEAKVNIIRVFTRVRLKGKLPGENDNYLPENTWISLAILNSGRVEGHADKRLIPIEIRVIMEIDDSELSS